MEWPWLESSVEKLTSMFKPYSSTWILCAFTWRRLSIIGHFFYVNYSSNCMFVFYLCRLFLPFKSDRFVFRQKSYLDSDLLLWHDTSHQQMKIPCKCPSCILCCCCFCILGFCNCLQAILCNLDIRICTRLISAKLSWFYSVKFFLSFFFKYWFLYVLVNG
jgi:hypothetical protein